MKSKAHQKLVAEFLIAAIQEAENDARKAGYYITMRALNRAKNALGWESAGELVKAEDAALPLSRKAG
jgi:hypothetical protein